jgi:uncharacterized membrane protein
MWWLKITIALHILSRGLVGSRYQFFPQRKIKADIRAQMYVLEISTKVYNYYTLSSWYVVLGAIAAIIIAVVVLIVFFAIAGFIIQLLAPVIAGIIILIIIVVGGGWLYAKYRSR